LKWLEVKQNSNDITLQGAERLIELVQKTEKIKNPTLRAQMHELLMHKITAVRSDPSQTLSRLSPTTGTTAITSVTSSLDLPKPIDEQE
jgi:hypothetical protein